MILHRRPLSHLHPPLLICIFLILTLLMVTSPTTAAVPSNDTFSGALAVTLPYSGTINHIENATFSPEAGEPVHGCRRANVAQGTYSLWFTFTLAESGVLTANTDGSDYQPSQDTLLSIYSGDTLPTLTEVACNDDISFQNKYSWVSVFLTPGTYIVKVSNWSMQDSLYPYSFLHLALNFIPGVTPTPTPLPSETPTLTPTPSMTLIPSTTPTGAESTTPTSTATAPGQELLQNGDFEVDNNGDAVPDGWTASLSGRDKRICNQPEKKPVAYSGECAFQFKGGVGEDSRLSQTLPILLAEQDTLTLTVAIKAKISAPITAAQVKLRYAEADAGENHNGKDKLVLKVLTSTGGYQVFSDSLTIAGTLETMVMRIRFKTPAGKLRLDAASLIYTSP